MVKLVVDSNGIFISTVNKKSTIDKKVDEVVTGDNDIAIARTKQKENIRKIRKSDIVNSWN